MNSTITMAPARRRRRVTLARPIGVRRPATNARFRQIAAASLACFTEGGYRLTQVAHVTERLGVSVGLVYRYVESKEALFYVAALQAVDRLPDDLNLPVKVSGLHQTVAAIRKIVAEDDAWPILASARSRRAPSDVEAEARQIAEELYDAVTNREALIRLLDRCSHDIPELAEIFDRDIRNRYMSDLVQWIQRRGLLEPNAATDAEALGRGVMEAVTWMARNRRGDRTAAGISEARAREAAVRIFTSPFNYPRQRRGRAPAHPPRMRS